MKLSRKRILLFTATLLFLMGLAFTAVYLKSVADYQKAVKETTFSSLDISNVTDGVYVGEYDVDFVYAKVEVTVKNGVSQTLIFWSIKTGAEVPQKLLQTRSLKNRK